MAKMVKKAQDGDNLRKGQYKRIGRISEKNPERAERVAERMNTRASRVDRGKEIANPSIMSSNPMNEMRMMDKDRMRMQLKDYNKMKKGGVVNKKMQMGAKAKNGGAFGMLSVKAGIDKNPNPTAADRIAGATKGKAKSGTKMKKAMMGTSMMDTPMMKKGGSMKKCKYGCK